MEDLSTTRFAEIRKSGVASVDEIKQICDLLADAVRALNRACRHDDPDNSGLCIKCGVVVDYDGPLSVVGYGDK